MRLAHEGREAVGGWRSQVRVPGERGEGVGDAGGMQDLAPVLDTTAVSRLFNADATRSRADQPGTRVAQSFPSACRSRHSSPCGDVKESAGPRENATHCAVIGLEDRQRTFMAR